SGRGSRCRLRPFGSGRRHKSRAHLADSAQCQLSDEDRADLSCVFGGEHIRWRRFLKRKKLLQCLLAAWTTKPKNSMNSNSRTRKGPAALLWFSFESRKPGGVDSVKNFSAPN